jgi:hypothetical protein
VGVVVVVVVVIFSSSVQPPAGKTLPSLSSPPGFHVRQGGGYGRVGKEKPSVAGGLKGRNQRRQPPSPMTCRMFSSRPRSYRFCGAGGLFPPPQV